MNRWNKLELETKIILISVAVFSLLFFPMQYILTTGLKSLASLSVDEDLGPVLVYAVQHSGGQEREAAIRSLERYRQWKAAAPLIVKEQRIAGLSFSIIVAILILIAYAAILKRLAKPLRRLSEAANLIGQGISPVIKVSGGGAIGSLEKAMADMAIELDRHRSALLTEGMEKAWRDMARIMAHEIKNPLTPIRLTLDRIDEKVASGVVLSKDEWQKFSERVATQLDQLEKLVSSFSSFAKEPEVKAINMDPRTVLEKVANGFKGSILAEFSGAAEAHADPLLLQQAALNIIKNSVEAGASVLSISIVQTEKFVEIDFHDNGSGVAKEEAEKIFLPYITNKPGGTGLGLAVVKRLIESMQGAIALPPNDKGGLLLRVKLPMASKQNLGETRFRKME